MLARTEKVKQHIKRLNILSTNKEKLYALIWGQFSTGLQEVLKGEEDFVKSDTSFDCIWLLEKSKLISSGVDTKANKYIDMPENIIGAVKMFPVGDPNTSSGDIFNIRYQIALNDLYTLANVALVDYYLMHEKLALVQELLVGKPMIRYNRHRNRLHIDEAMGDLKVGQFLVIECYEIVDPTVYGDVWADRWLQFYVTQLIKRQWGQNLSKFEGLQLPGGVQFNGRQIYDDAQAEINKLEEEMLNAYSLPVGDMVG